MSLSEKDEKLLRRTGSSSFRVITFIVLSLTVTILLVLAILNLQLCLRFASSEGMTITEVMGKWVTGISATEVYSGELILAMQRAQVALTQVLIAVILGIVLWERQSLSKRHARILGVIEK